MVLSLLGLPTDCPLTSRSLKMVKRVKPTPWKKNPRTKRKESHSKMRL